MREYASGADAAAECRPTRIGCGAETGRIGASLRGSDGGGSMALVVLLLSNH